LLHKFSRSNGMSILVLAGFDNFLSIKTLGILFISEIWAISKLQVSNCPDKRGSNVFVNSVHGNCVSYIKHIFTLKLIL